MSNVYHLEEQYQRSLPEHAGPHCCLVGGRLAVSMSGAAGASAAGADTAGGDSSLGSDIVRQHNADEFWNSVSNPIVKRGGVFPIRWLKFTNRLIRKENDRQYEKNKKTVQEFTEKKVNFFWKPEPKLKKLHDKLFDLKAQLKAGNVLLDDYVYDQKSQTYTEPCRIQARRLRQQIGNIRQKLRQKETWVIAYITKVKTGEVIMGWSKWTPDKVHPVLTNVLRVQLKVWAAERLQDKKKNVFFKVDPFTTTFLSTGTSIREQLSKWYRQTEKCLKQQLYISR